MHDARAPVPSIVSEGYEQEGRVLTVAEVEARQRRTAAFLDEAGIVVAPNEVAEIDIDDFGFGEPDRIGLQSLVYVSTSRICAKEIVLFPGQTCPEHRHPPFDDDPGKVETFRCRFGLAYVYVPGEPTATPACRPPRIELGVYTVWHEVVLRAGDQLSLEADTLHWLQAGAEGAIVSEFSSACPAGVDVFTDPEVEPETTVIPA
jgi:D-lyxose ketol-isomerase